MCPGGYSHAPDELAYGVDMRHVRWGGILQRIALAYLVVAVLEMVTKDGAKVHQDQPPGSSGRFSRVFRMYLSQWYATQRTARFFVLSSFAKVPSIPSRQRIASIYMYKRIVACCILVVYLSLAYGVYVPDWEFRVRNADSPDYGKVLTVDVLPPPAFGCAPRELASSISSATHLQCSSLMPTGEVWYEGGVGPSLQRRRLHRPQSPGHQPHVPEAGMEKAQGPCSL